MNRYTLLIALFVVLVGALAGGSPVIAAPGPGDGGDQPWDPCPPKTRSAPPYEDSDRDGLYDCEEVNIFGTDKFDANTDNDGLSDGEEVSVYGTDPLLVDTDGDSYSDYFEVMDYGTDPLAADFDSDGDGFPDGAELTLGMDPANPDTDGDGLLDKPDTFCGGKGWTEYSKALTADFDGDGLGDYYEKNVSGTHGCLADTDDDGFDDAEELNSGTDPTDAGSFP